MKTLLHCINACYLKHSIKLYGGSKQSNFLVIKVLVFMQIDYSWMVKCLNFFRFLDNFHQSRLS